MKFCFVSQEWMKNSTLWENKGMCLFDHLIVYAYKKDYYKMGGETSAWQLAQICKLIQQDLDYRDLNSIIGILSILGFFLGSLQSKNDLDYRDS